LVLEEEEDCIIASDKRIIPQISWDRSMRYMESEGEYRCIRYIHENIQILIQSIACK
jgi:hypothetical protein